MIKTTPSVYDLESVKLPYLYGFLLKMIVRMLESPLRVLLSANVFKSSGITALRKRRFKEPPTLPVFIHDMNPPDIISIASAQWPGIERKKPLDFKFPGVHDYTQAYREGKITPVTVAERLLKAIEKSDSDDPPLRAFIAVNPEDLLKQAKASARRYKEGKPFGVFDGVPVAVKDEIDMLPYPTTAGTVFLGAEPVKEDATIIVKMRATGALMIGKANMHEIGLGVTGQNPHYGTPRNPYDPARYTGGSSSGPAAAVAAGFCPVALGADGGGSIRIPSAFCGLCGIKATFGRISDHGTAPVVWSLGHLGPIAGSARDAALAYAAIAGADPKDRFSLRQPRPVIAGWNKAGLDGLTLGVFWPWFRHADEIVVSTCGKMLREFSQMGAKIIEVEIPGLEAGRVAQLITIAAEMSQRQEEFYKKHHRKYGLDVRFNLALARLFTARDYIKAQQIRTQMTANFNRVLQKVDAIMTPTTGITAPVIPKAALSHGDSDLTTLTEIMRFVTPANLTGLPAISFPVGYTGTGLPVGMHAIGRPWEEVSLFRLAFAAEQKFGKRKPKVFFNLLEEEYRKPIQ
ncbi:amidase [candidate division KSB1 bacterium]|nr:amidase [candidate division KSB1 bacterium]